MSALSRLWFHRPPSVDRRLMLVLIGCLAAAGVAHGNGGGYHYGVKFTGSVAPFEPEGTENVQIVDEFLDVELGARSARVMVRYRLQNLSDQRARVVFGFPVEAALPRYIAEDEMPPTQAELLAEYCRDYGVTLNGEALESTFVEEPFASGRVKAFPGSEVLDGIAGWQVSELELAGGASAEMVIGFRSDYEIDGVSVSEDSRTQAPLFRYRLSSGGVWAGPIASGTVRVHGTDEIEFAQVHVKSPANRFEKIGDAWVWEFTDLEPTLADDLEIVAGPAVNRYADPVSYSRDDDRWAYFVRNGDRWQREHQDFSVSASSVLAADGEIAYAPENVYGYDWSDEFAVWCEGADGHGLGESLTLTVEKPLPLDEILIRPGYGKSEELYRANSRPSKVEVVLNGEHRFIAELVDEDRRQTVHVRGYDKPVETVKLIIVDVFPGSRHRDTCVASVHLVGHLPEEPKRYGAR